MVSPSTVRKTESLWKLDKNPLFRIYELTDINSRLFPLSSLTYSVFVTKKQGFWFENCKQSRTDLETNKVT